MASDPRIICGFPGVGKSYAADRLDAWDSDSSAWPRDESWPAAYVESVRRKGPLVLCSTHAEVRAALRGAGVPFGVAYPERSLLDEYLRRYEGRGSGDKVNLADLYATLADLGFHRTKINVRSHAGTRSSVSYYRGPQSILDPEDQE